MIRLPRVPYYMGKGYYCSKLGGVIEAKGGVPLASPILKIFSSLLILKDSWILKLRGYSSPPRERLHPGCCHPIDAVIM